MQFKSNKLKWQNSVINHYSMSSQCMQKNLVSLFTTLNLALGYNIFVYCLQLLSYQFCSLVRLIDWCLKPTLAVLQLYRGAS
jgi:hypothetical protein